MKSKTKFILSVWVLFNTIVTLFNYGTYLIDPKRLNFPNWYDLPMIMAILTIVIAGFFIINDDP